MCGIFGVFVGADSGCRPSEIASLAKRLFLLSESRGKESAGVAVRTPGRNSLSVLKTDVAASEFVRSPAYRALIDRDAPFWGHGAALIGHSRLVTNGSQALAKNNQPVQKGDVVVVHNGIIVNVDELWNKHAGEIHREAEVDTEVFAALVARNVAREASIARAVTGVFGELVGAASVAGFHAAFDKAFLASNTGSLYFVANPKRKVLVFASERYILEQALAKEGLAEWGLLPAEIRWNRPFTGTVVDLVSMKESSFAWGEGATAPGAELDELRPIRLILEEHSPSTPPRTRAPLIRVDVEREKRQRALLLDVSSEVKKLKRCTRCILPESFPFLEFDSEGVCNLCCHYKPRQGLRPLAEFEALLSKYRKADGTRQDCLVALSGGRDSCYGLHLVKKELGMNPLTFTYDWGMVTDLARRNIARMTGQLGVENILVSADIRKKRENIRLNLEAWLKRPDLGIIPLFMAGDKYFFRIANQIKRQTGIAVDIWMTNYFENTEFKSGFCGIAPDFAKERIDALSSLRQFQMLFHYFREFMANPSYWNSSVPDTLGSYHSYYLEPRTGYHLLFDYFSWDEKTVERTLVEQYGWELAPDTRSSWRIGDGTASFYNYVYYTIAGFSEVETFRSNQIREGAMGREEALERSFEENLPRFESMKAYLDTVGIEFERVIEAVNKVPRLYGATSGLTP